MSSKMRGVSRRLTFRARQRYRYARRRTRGFGPVGDVTLEYGSLISPLKCRGSDRAAERNRGLDMDENASVLKAYLDHAHLSRAGKESY